MSDALFLSPVNGTTMAPHSFFSACPLNCPVWCDTVAVGRSLADEPVPDWVNQNNRHAYYAAVSYVDEHIGTPADECRS